MSPFPLLRLPGVVLCEVFKSLSIGEKIKLSLCSNKISTQINSSRLYSQKVIVDLGCLSHKIKVHSENDKETFEILIYPDHWNRHNSNTQPFSIACSTVRVMSTGIGIETFWKDDREGFLSVIRHLLKMFQCKISASVSCYHNDSFHPTISTLFGLQLKFKMLSILINQNVLFNQISSNFGLIEDLKIISVTNPGFRPVFSSSPQKINIFGSYFWFTLDSLLACTSIAIRLGESHFCNKDLDVILRKWKAGGLPNLKYLWIHSPRSTDNRDHILGANPMELDGMTIQTNDGSKKATIKLDLT